MQKNEEISHASHIRNMKKVVFFNN